MRLQAQNLEANKWKGYPFSCLFWNRGTISGCARYLKEQNPSINVIGVDAYGSVLKKYHETGELDTKEIYPYRIEGLGKNLIPTATDFDSIDTFIKVTDKDSAHTAREITKNEGLFGCYTWCCHASSKTTK